MIAHSSKFADGKEEGIHRHGVHDVTNGTPTSAREINPAAVKTAPINRPPALLPSITSRSFEPFLREKEFAEAMSPVKVFSCASCARHRARPCPFHRRHECAPPRHHSAIDHAEEVGVEANVVRYP